MGRHDLSNTATVAYGPSRGVIGGRHVAAEPSPRGVTIGGLDASTVAIIPAPAGRVGPTALGPAPGHPELSTVHAAIPPAGPPARLGWRARRAARHEAAEQAALAARIARAERRSRQVAAWAPAMPVPRDPQSGELARPPWVSPSG